MNYLKSRFNNKYLLCTLFLILSIGCKTTSFTAAQSDYGIDAGDEFFSIAILPDTQYYTAGRWGGSMDYFQNQISWIRKNREKENIQYVVHLGDVTDRNTPEEWTKAKNMFAQLDEDNIPYGITVGNHDETPGNRASQGDPNTNYTKFFGRKHFGSKPWFGGAMGNNENTDNHFDLFTSNGQKYLAMYFVYNEPNNQFHDAGYEQKVNRWADSVLNKYSDHKAILIAHSVLNRISGIPSELRPGTNSNEKVPNFTRQGQVLFEVAKKNQNVFLMLGGHISGESFRRDEVNGRVIKTYLADYQARRAAPYETNEDRNGGGGLMRLMKFNTSKQTLVTVSFAPDANGEAVHEEDGDSRFIQPLFK